MGEETSASTSCHLLLLEHNRQQLYKQSFRSTSLNVTFSVELRIPWKGMLHIPFPVNPSSRNNDTFNDDTYSAYTKHHLCLLHQFRIFPDTSGVTLKQLAYDHFAPRPSQQLFQERTKQYLTSHSAMGFPSGIVLVLKRDWTPVNRTRRGIDFDGSRGSFFPELIILQKDIVAWLPRQEPFQKSGDYREWVSIALYYPSLPVLLYSNRSGSIHWDSLEDYNYPYDDRLIQVPASYLSAEVFVFRDFLPGVPEYDTLVAQHPHGEVGIFLKGDVATHEEFSTYPPTILRVRGADRTADGQRRHCLIPYSFIDDGIYEANEVENKKPSQARRDIALAASAAGYINRTPGPPVP
ncbi:hypothetical protein CSAL01_09059 [Colletotrichum salicis]|uniref:Uncharacterized protein n=1 Tax=Colletotrichum salicis TaxID=1209931 RepID=A0A135SAS6_9PEZI|nr:hypothetical protein CSAL01_09059 [Colletotrichum salicis]